VVDCTREIANRQTSPEIDGFTALLWQTTRFTGESARAGIRAPYPLLDRVKPYLEQTS